ncbi:MAG TPA: hypothetical protein VNE18_02895 [Rhodanobacter sp.]|nr:hypothetical protein [Rhodanobacter sp.]
MTIPCPAPQWPSGLLEVGPEQDRSILLRSVAEIGDAAYAVIAIRMDRIRMEPDLRGDVPGHVYNNYQLHDMLDALLLYSEVSERSLVHLPTGAYVMLMIPATSS